MGVEDFADLATEAFDVASETLSDGFEFLSDGFVDGFDQLQEQVGSFAGESDWFNANSFGDITNLSSTITDLDPTLGGAFTEVNGIFVSTADLQAESFSNIFSGAKEALGIPTELGSSFGGDLLTKAGSVADDFTRSIGQQFSPANINRVVTDFAVQQGRQIVGQTISQVVPPALQPYANQAVNATTRSLSGAAAVSSVTPGTPGFVGPPAPLTTNSFPEPTNAGPSFQQFDDGSSLQTFEDGSTLAIDADGKPTATPAPTDYGATRTVNDNTGGVIQTFDDGSTLTTFPDGKTVATPATPDPTSLTQSFTQAADSVVRALTPGTVNDANLALPPLSVAAALAAAASLVPGGTAATTAIADAAARAQGLLRQAQNQQTARVQANNNAATGDWRVRLQLADSADYLYNAPDCGPLLWPLRDTNGVIFPYTPTIDTSYKANYSTYDLTHSNYRGYFYQNSYIDGINIKGTFTAQDTTEANYLLAVIHFFRSVTKMFYGQDAQRGTPPPMVFLSGLGDFQFNKHPCVVSQFNYNLPADVNYIRAQSTLSNGGNQLAARTRQTTLGNPIASTIQRLSSLGQKIFPGAVTAPFAPQGSLAAGNPTYVPTKMEISLVLLPVQTRSQVSQQFSVRGFANGNLLKGGFW